MTFGVILLVRMAFEPSGTTGQLRIWIPVQFCSEEASFESYWWIYIFSNSTVCLREVIFNKRLQVAYTLAHAYMWALVPHGSLCFFSVLYMPDVTISYEMRVVAESVVTNQSRFLEPEV